MSKIYFAISESYIKEIIYTLFFFFDEKNTRFLILISLSYKTRTGINEDVKSCKDAGNKPRVNCYYISISVCH